MKITYQLPGKFMNQEGWKNQFIPILFTALPFPRYGPSAIGNKFHCIGTSVYKFMKECISWYMTATQHKLLSIKLYDRIIRSLKK